MKILFIPNWRVNRLSTDVPTIQAPDKQVQGEPYWFFKYFPEGTQVDIIDILNRKGVFLLKGSVSHVAQTLHSSEASIYRYLGKLNNRA